jgi:HK97 family phage major capsid protein
MTIEERNILKKEATEICELCKKEIRGMTDAEKARYYEIKSILLENRAKEDEEDEKPEDNKEDEKPEDNKEDENKSEENPVNKEDESKSDEDEDTEKNPEDEEDEEKNPEDNKKESESDEDEEDKPKENKEDDDNKEDRSLLNKQKNNIINSKMEKRFSLINAINAVANNRSLSQEAQAVIEAGRNEMTHAGLSYSGQIQIPVDTRATVTVANEGEDVVVTDFTDIMEPLRAKNVLVQAGAKYISGCVGDIQVPIMSAENVGWEGEIADAPDGAGEFTNVKLQPKRLTAFIDISKKFLAQDSLSAEALIRADLVNAINSKLEATILGAEAATDVKPAGIFADTELSTLDTFASVCDFEAELEEANVLGEPKYIMSPKAKAKFRAMQKSSKNTELVYQNGTLDGTPVLTTSNVADTNVAFGDFANLAIAQWGNLDITVDPYTKAAAGQVRIVVNAFFDAKVLRPEGIKVAKA